MTPSSTLPTKQLVQSDSSGPKFGVRHGQAILLFTCAAVAYWTRINVSVAVVAMTNNELNNTDFQHFDWNEQEKSYIFSSFFWGYIVIQIPAGKLGQRYGTRVMLLLTVLCPSILTALTPICVTYGGWMIFCVVRVLEGFFGGALFPLFHIHIAKWAPLKERNCIGGVSYSGIQAGTILGFLLSGMIASTSLGWPGIFYIPASFGFLWSTVWYLYGTNGPEESKSISLDEKKYIELSSETSKNSSKIPTPWKKILTSMPFIALICARMTYAWGSATFLTEIPTYMNSILNMDMKSSAIYSSLPYIIMLILSYIFLLIAEILGRKELVSLTVIRKSYSTIAQWGPTIGLTGLAFVRADNVTLALVLLTISIALSSGSGLGSALNHIDLSPNHAGVLMAITNTMTIIVSIIVPLAVGAIITNEHFVWNEQEKSYILSSFFWGYVVIQIPAGKLGQRYGTRLLLLLAILCPSILTVLTPICVTYGGWMIFCLLRVLEGFFGGAIFPLFHIHIAKWAPLKERNCIGGLSYSGIQVGTILGFLSSGMIASTILSWPGVFYIPGTFGLIWSALWYLYGANGPEEARFISSAEKKYIESTSESSHNSFKMPTPWKQILTSVPFIALTCTRMSTSWGSATFLTEIPTYMNSILNMDMKSNAIYSALPYIIMFNLSYIYLVIAEILAKKKSVSITKIRKVYSTIAEWGPAIGLLGLAFVSANNVPLAITLLTTSIAISSGSVIGSGLNPIDLSPNHAGILMGIANTMSNVIAIIVPLVVGVIVTNERDHSQWQILFFIAAGVYFVGNLIYIIFGKMEKQHWNEPGTDNTNNRRTSLIL